jgi:hypothetical protein
MRFLKNKVFKKVLKKLLNIITQLKKKVSLLRILPFLTITSKQKKFNLKDSRMELFMRFKKNLIFYVSTASKYTWFLSLWRKFKSAWHRLILWVLLIFISFIITISYILQFYILIILSLILIVAITLLYNFSKKFIEWLHRFYMNLTYLYWISPLLYFKYFFSITILIRIISFFAADTCLISVIPYVPATPEVENDVFLHCPDFSEEAQAWMAQFRNAHFRLVWSAENDVNVAEIQGRQKLILATVYPSDANISAAVEEMMSKKIFHQEIIEDRQKAFASKDWDRILKNYELYVRSRKDIQDSWKILEPIKDQIRAKF